jgi:uncharacterized protein (DUF362 family)
VKKKCRIHRRSFLKGALAGAALASVPGVLRASIPKALPTAPVAVGRCRRYEFDTAKGVISQLFDQIGGVRDLVNGKTVTVKVNLTSSAWHPEIYTLSVQETTYTHPVVALATLNLLSEAGASRIYLCESMGSTQDAKASFQACGYDVALFESMVSNLFWEDTRHLGSGADYKELPVGDGAAFFDRFYLNHRYVDTDVMVSVAKMKNHDIAGITLAHKNLFGITPPSLYSGGTQDEERTDARIDTLHEGGPTAAGNEVLPIPSLDRGIRVPNIITDIVKARPIDLSVIDGVVSMHGGEGAWNGPRLGITTPGLLIAGRNSVCTDSVTASIMGYDPEAPRHAKPFYPGDNTCHLGAQRGIGTNLVSEIEVVGLRIEEARYAYLPVLKPPQND